MLATTSRPIQWVSLKHVGRWWPPGLQNGERGEKPLGGFDSHVLPPKHIQPRLHTATHILTRSKKDVLHEWLAFPMSLVASLSPPAFFNLFGILRPPSHDNRNITQSSTASLARTLPCAWPVHTSSRILLQETVGKELQYYGAGPRPLIPFHIICKTACLPSFRRIFEPVVKTIVLQLRMAPSTAQSRTLPEPCRSGNTYITALKMVWSADWKMRE